MASIAYSNNPREVIFYILSPGSNDFYQLGKAANCKQLVSTYDRQASDLVIELAELAEQRKSGRRLGPAVVLAIDALETLLSFEAYNVNVHLRWLLEHGPKSCVWPVATLQNASVRKVERRVLQEFGTVITSAGLTANRLLPGGGDPSPGSHAGLFSTRLGSEIIQFWLPDAE